MDAADRYRRLAATFDETLAAVTPEGWARQSPCEEWTAQDVLAHVIESEAAFAERAGKPLTLALDPAGGPVAAWRELRDGMQALLDDPETAGREYESLGSTTTLADSADSFLAFDLIVHRWDIATAADLPANIPCDDIDAGNAFIESVADLFYRYGASKPPIDVPADATPQQRLLARAGRRAP